MLIIYLLVLSDCSIIRNLNLSCKNIIIYDYDNKSIKKYKNYIKKKCEKFNSIKFTK